MNKWFWTIFFFIDCGLFGWHGANLIDGIATDSRASNGFFLTLTLMMFCMAILAMLNVRDS